MIKRNWKFYLGVTFIVLSFVLPLFGFLVPFLGLPVGVAAVLTGFLVLGGPEVMIVLAVLFLGRPVFNLIKEKVFRIFKRKGPPKPVSMFRYYLGLIIFFGSVTPYYINVYAPHWFPENETHRLYWFIGGDLSFVCSFFVLGGAFWEKFKRLFIWKD
ncbi:MAG: transporter suffix domain-containing protein [Simkania sp.]|nr:transporter suffix domain-containing protein [Simkania sp.]MCB1083281.1 transporter suffix domain-containing protein [Simkania sp.]MCP5490265.1 transporter suffix domain-containing protein [Chlamydiales bacterium]